MPLPVKVPEFTNGVPDAERVMLPELGAIVQVAPLVKVPATVKEVLAVTEVDEQAVVKF